MISNIYKRIALGLLGAVTGLAGVLLLYEFSYFQKIYPFVFVGQNNLSNLTIDEAEKVLAKNVPAETKILEVGFGNQSFEVRLEGLKYDSKLTAEKAYLQGREEDFLSNLRYRWGLWFEKKNIEMEYEINKNAVREQVDLIGSQLDIPPIYYGLKKTEDNRVMVVPGKNGRVVNKEEFLRDIYSRVSVLDFSTISLEVSLIEMGVDPEFLEMTQKRGEALLKKKIELSYGNTKREISGQSLLDLIDFKGGFYDEKVNNLLVLMSKEINREAQDAVFRFEGGKVTEFKPAIEGLKLDEEKSFIEVMLGLKSLEAGKDKVVVELAVTSFPPEIQISQINNLGIIELLGTGESTFYHSIPSRVHNVALTAYKLNGVLVKPGEEFSFNNSVGDISATTGYKSAYIIKDGRTILGDGGGVCQDSTTLFRAALDAGLPITERHPHAYRVSYYEQNSPAGIDATIYSPSTDLKFLNDTPAHLLIQTTVNPSANYLKVEIYGTSDGRVATISNTRLWDQTPPPEPKFEDTPSLAPGVVSQIDWAAWGAKASFDWKVVRNNEVLQEKTFYSNYRPWQAVYLRGV